MLCDFSTIMLERKMVVNCHPAKAEEFTDGVYHEEW